MERKTFGFELTGLDYAGRTFEGYAAVFGNVDQGGDIIHPGAFRKTLAERGGKVKLLWQHDPQEPLGRPLEIREDSRGLFVKGIVSDTVRGRDALALLQDKAIDGMSIGYDPVRGGTDYGKMDGETVRNLRELKLWEISFVTFPMNEEAQVTALKVVDVTENTIRIRVRDPEDFQEDSFRTITLSEEEGIQAVIGKLKGETSTTVQAYIFDKEKWTVARAKQWVEERENPEKEVTGAMEVKFHGSPRNPYGTHASRGYPNGHDGWVSAWRIYLSRIPQGPIQGTVRRVAMIAAGMKPVCELPEMSAEEVGPRPGAEGELPGKLYEKPSDYGLDHWKKPSDDNLEQEDIQLTCQDLKDLKKLYLQEIAKRQQAREEEGGKGQEMTFLNVFNEDLWMLLGTKGEVTFFEELAQETAERDLFNERWRMSDALIESIRSIMTSLTLDDDGKRSALQETLGQYSTAIIDWAMRGLSVGFWDIEDSPAGKGLKAGRVLAARNAERIAAALRALEDVLRDAGVLDGGEGEGGGEEEAGKGKETVDQQRKTAGPVRPPTEMLDEAKNYLLMIELMEVEDGLEGDAGPV